MSRLPDGTVVPAFVGVSDTSGYSEYTFDMLTDTTLRVGEVVKAFPPNSPENLSKTVWEYEVHAVSFRKEGTTQEAYQPYRARVAEMFGNQADHLRYSVRPASRPPAKGESLSNGSLVLVLCPNGDKGQALIIGAVRNTRENKPDPTSTFFSFAFNGVNANIVESGAFSLDVVGPTKLDGTPKGKNKVTSLITDEKIKLGNLAKAIGELVSVIANIGVIGQVGNLGVPVPINPKLVTQLQQWSAKYIKGNEFIRMKE